MGYCHTSDCRTGDSAAAAVAAGEATRRARIDSTVNNITCAVGPVARAEKRSLNIKAQLEGLNYSDKADVLTALKQKGYRVVPSYYGVGESIEW